MIEQVERLRAATPGWIWDAGVAVLAAAIGIAIALLVHRIAYRVIERLAAASEGEADDIVVRHLRKPTRYAMMALGIVLAARETPALNAVWVKFAGFLMPALVGWMALAVLQSFVNAMEVTRDTAVADSLAARRRRTRLAIFSRIGSFIIILVTAGLMLISIPGVRDLGVTLMASAGLAGLAVGAAAQPALKSLIGGLQVVLTEPISIDDVVVVDGHNGVIEDIRTTYVVVRTWDERRLVVPTTKFLDHTFENWTKGGTEMLVPVLLQLDPLMEIEPVREEFHRRLQAHPLWDGRVAKAQVTDAAASSVTVRLLMSAQNPASALDLQCDIREGMLAWLRENRPEPA